MYPQAYPQQPPYPMAPPAQQYPPQPQYPAAPAQPYYPQQPPAYPAPHAAPLPPAPAGSLDDFFGQRSNSGPSWKFMNKPINTSYTGMVARPVTNADVQAVTDDGGRVMTFRDGRTKFQMIVPMMFPPTAEYPDGQAGWYVKGQSRDELARAMAEAGAPEGPPEAGATIRVTLVQHRPIPGKNPQFIYRVEYVRPQGAPPAPAQAPVEQAPATPPLQAQVPLATPMAMPQQFPAQPVPQQPVTQAPAPATGGMSQEQLQLLAQLTGQPQG